MTPAEKVRSFRESKELTQGALGMVIGLKAHQVRDIESGKQKVSEAIAKQIEKNFYISYKNFLFDDDLPITEVNKINDEYTTIKLFPNIKASCANGSVCVVEDYDIQEMRFPTSYLLNNLGIKCAKNVHAIVADGNSMEPLIKDGDILFVTPFDTVRDGNVYIVNVNGDIYCKKVYKNPITKGLTLRGENEIAPKYEISENDMDTVKFMGEVFVVMNVNVLRRLR